MLFLYSTLPTVTNPQPLPTAKKIGDAIEVEKKL